MLLFRYWRMLIFRCYWQGFTRALRAPLTNSKLLVAPRLRLRKRTMKVQFPRSIRFQKPANARAGLLIFLGLIFGSAGGGLMVYRVLQKKPPAPAVENLPTLSESTRTVLGELKAPVEVHFYALFGGDAAASRLSGFATNINTLLTTMEAEAQGKIIVTRYETWTPANIKNATTDGIAPAEVGGDPAYVGIAISQDRRKEALARLAPEWAAALEFDVARTIARVGVQPEPAQTVQQVAENNQAIEAVKQTIPNAVETSFEDGKRMLLEAGLKSYQTLVAEMNAEVAKAEQSVQQSAEADRRAAVEKLQQVQARYAEKLRNVALQSQAQIEAWTKSKGL